MFAPVLDVSLELAALLCGVYISCGVCHRSWAMCWHSYYRNDMLTCCFQHTLMLHCIALWRLTNTNYTAISLCYVDRCRALLSVVLNGVNAVL
jgi:hypothetical protein